MSLESIKTVVRQELFRFFCQLPYYNEFVHDKMITIIDSITAFEDLCQENTRMMLERLFTSAALAQPKAVMSTETFGEIEHALLAVYVLIQYYNDEFDPHSNFFHNTDVLLDRYPVFAGLGAEDLNLLLRFRNLMVCALKLTSAGQNKKALLNICAMLEGREKPIKYHTGTGMTLHTTRRVLIYLRETNLQLEEQRQLEIHLQKNPERRANNREPKIMVVPTLPNEVIAIYAELPEDIEDRLLSIMKTANHASLSMDAWIALRSLTKLFRDVRMLDVLLGGAVLQELSSKIQKLKANNAFIQDLTAALNIDEQQILARHFPGYEQSVSNSNDAGKEFERLWNRLKAAVSVLKLLLLQDTPAAKNLLYQNEDVFLANYCEKDFQLTYLDLAGNDQSLLDQEQGYLFKFANAMRLLRAASPHRLEQTHLLRVGERMEGSHNRYTTGGGCSEPTKRRQLIARRETGKEVNTTSRSGKCSKKRAVDVFETESAAGVKRGRKASNTPAPKRLRIEVYATPLNFSALNHTVPSCSSSSSYISSSSEDDDHELFQVEELEEAGPPVATKLAYSPSRDTIEMEVDPEEVEQDDEDEEALRSNSVEEDGVMYESDENDENDELHYRCHLSPEKLMAMLPDHTIPMIDHPQAQVIEW